MTTPEQLRSTFSNKAEMTSKWAAVAEQSQRVVQAFAERQAEEGGFSIVDTQGVSRAFLDMMTKMMADPVKLAEAQGKLLQENMQLWQATAAR